MVIFVQRAVFTPLLPGVPTDARTMHVVSISLPVQDDTPVRKEAIAEFLWAIARWGVSHPVTTLIMSPTISLKIPLWTKNGPKVSAWLPLQVSDWFQQTFSRWGSWPCFERSQYSLM